jgi:tetratricopeptide (TPR) repeat protein
VDALRRLADAVEQAPLGPGRWLATFLAIVALRHLLEILSARVPVYRPAAFLVHYPLAYLAPALTLALLLSLLARWPVRRVTRLMLPAAALLLLPPLVDLSLPLLAGIPGLPATLRETVARHAEAPATIGYLYGEEGFLSALVHFLDPRRPLEGTTAGIRVEALVAALLGAAFVVLRRRAWWRAVLTVPVILLTAFLFFTLPTRFLDLVRLFRPALTMDTLYGGEGLLPGPGSIHDGVSILYLATLILLVLLAWSLRDGGWPALRSGLATLDWGGGLTVGVLTVVGLTAGVLTRTGLQPDLALSLYDRLAVASLAVAAILLGTGLGADRPGRTVSLLAGASALCLTLGAGYPALAGALILVGACWLWGGGSAALSRRPGLGTLAGGLVGLAAVAFGYLAVTGQEGLGWIPGPLLLAGFLAGAGVTLATRPPDHPPVDRVLVGCATAAALLPALSWPLCLAAPAPLLTIAVLFFGGASLLVCLLLAHGGPRGLMAGILGAAALASALLTLTHPLVREDLTRGVLSRPGYHLARGNVFQERRAFREAEQEYRLALTMDPGGIEPLLRLGGLEVARAEMVLEAAGLPDIRTRTAVRAELDEEVRSRLRAAAEHFERALTRDPDHPTIRYNLGAALFQLGELEEAERAFAAVLAQRPGHLGALWQRAEVLLKLERPGEAAASLEAYLEAAAEDPAQAAGRARARELLRILPPR